MPRKDRTFSSKDLIRLVRGNASSKEQSEVLLELCRGVKIEDFGDGPILVDITSAEEALEDVDLVQTVVDLISVRIVSKLPQLLVSTLDIVISKSDLRSLIQIAARK